jgi:hypothetical protein
MCEEEEEEDPGLDFKVAYSLHSSKPLRFPKTITSAAALPV